MPLLLSSPSLFSSSLLYHPAVPFNPSFSLVSLLSSSPSFLSSSLPSTFYSFIPLSLPTVIQNLACLIVHAFKELKAYEMTSSCGLLRHSALGLAFLRVLLRNITVFQKRNIDILLKRLNVAYVRTSSLFSAYIFFMRDFPN